MLVFIRCRRVLRGLAFMFGGGELKMGFDSPLKEFYCIDFAILYVNKIPFVRNTSFHSPCLYGFFLIFPKILKY